MTTNDVSRGAPASEPEKSKSKLLSSNSETKKRQKPAPKRHLWFSEVSILKFIAIMCLIMIGIKLLGLSCGEALKVWREVAANFN